MLVLEDLGECPDFALDAGGLLVHFVDFGAVFLGHGEQLLLDELDGGEAVLVLELLLLHISK